MAEIKLTKNFDYDFNNRGSRAFSVGEAVEDECIAGWDNDPYSRQNNGDRAMESVERTSRMLADVISILVEKDIISPSEVLSLVGSYWKIIE